MHIRTDFSHLAAKFNSEVANGEIFDTATDDVDKQFAITARIRCWKWTFVGKVISLLFNMLSRFVITFLPRSKHL